MKRAWQNTEGWHPALRYGGVVALALVVVALVAAVPQLILLALIAWAIVAMVGSGGNGPGAAVTGGETDRVYTATVFGGGNLFKREQIVLEDGYVCAVRPRFFGRGEEQRVRYDSVASVRVDKGLIWASVVIETMGGAASDLEVKGFRKPDAEHIRDEMTGSQAGPRARDRRPSRGTGWDARTRCRSGTRTSACETRSRGPSTRDVRQEAS